MVRPTVENDLRPFSEFVGKMYNDFGIMRRLAGSSDNPLLKHWDPDLNNPRNEEWYRGHLLVLGRYVRWIEQNLTGEGNWYLSPKELELRVDGELIDHHFLTFPLRSSFDSSLLRGGIIPIADQSSVYVTASAYVAGYNGELHKDMKITTPMVAMLHSEIHPQDSVTVYLPLPGVGIKDRSMETWRGVAYRKVGGFGSFFGLAYMRSSLIDAHR